MFGRISFLILLIGSSQPEVTSESAPEYDLDSTWTPQEGLPENANNLALRLTNLTPSSPIWNMRTSILEMLSSLVSSKSQVEEGRGRLPFMIPVMYNLGIITTLLVLLAFSAVKGLALGIIILILSLHAKDGWKSSVVHAPRPVLFHYHTTKPHPPPPSKFSHYPEPWERLGHGHNKTISSSIHHKYPHLRS